MMLLPSDVARLVLGYLQEEGLASTSQTFITESPNLKEYAEHGTEDGVIPACVFSLFGKNLATILNEYVAAKAKETSHEVPVMMTSLWKKLDFTLNQIKCLQNSPAIAATQRMRSRYGLAHIRRQRALTQSPSSGTLCSASVPETGSILSPIQTPPSVLGHSTPVSYTPQTRHSIRGTHLQIQEGGRLVTMARDSPVQILVPDQRLLPGPTSPGRRKWDSPRRMRGGSLNASSGTGRSSMPVSSLATEPPAEEAVNSQLVIQNAREKILGDRSLQEKLAENINKILASDPSPQTSKASCSTVEPDQSIDEILGLQGEIHMSDDAIHDILEQTESDPAFQALFELFDYSKTKAAEAEQGEGNVSSTPEESNAAGPPSAAGPPQGGDQGAAHEDVPAAPEPTPGSVTLVQEPKTKKTRKSATPSSLKTTALNSSGRDSRLENSRVRLLVSQEKQPAVKRAARRHESSAFTSSDTAAPMDVDDPLNAPPPPPPPPPLPPPPPPADTTSLQHVFKRPRKDAAPTSTALRRTGGFLSLTSNAAAPAACRTPTVTAADASTAQGERRAPEAGGKTSVRAAALSPSLNSPPALTIVIPALEEVSKTPPHAGANPQPKPAVAVSETAPKPASSVPLTTASGTQTLLPSLQSKEAVDPSKIVALEIIISEEQEEASAGDSALNQAVSSISGDRIPTIFLSSPAKSPAKAFVGVPGALVAHQDETTQAVSDLQSSEVGKPALVAASALPGTSQAPSSYIIQLPFDAANPGAATSYILVTEPASTDAQAKQVLVPVGQQRQLLPASPYAQATPPRPQTYPAGSALILQSPGQPVVLPVAVSVGQSSAGKVQVVSNKFVTVPSPAARKQPEPIKPQSCAVAFRQPTVPSIGGVAVQKVVRKVVKPPSAEKSGQQKVQAGTRRVLSFDSGEPTTPVGKTTTPTTVSKTTTPPAVSTPVQHKEKDKPKSAPRTRPAILCDKKPKRRIEPISCTDKTPTGSAKQTEKTPTGSAKQTEKTPTGSAKQTEKTLTGSAKQTEKTPTGSAKQTDKTPSPQPQQQQKRSGRKTPRKQDHKSNERLQSESVIRVETAQPESSKKTGEKTGEGAKATDAKQNTSRHDDDDGDDDGAKPKEPRSGRSSSSDYKLRSESKKEREDAGRKELPEKSPKPREGRVEKKTTTPSSEESPRVMANKENEVKGSSRPEPPQQLTASSAPKESSPPAVVAPTPAPQPKSGKPPSKAASKTSPLTKQAAAMFQDIHGLNPPSTPVKRAGVGSPDLPLPRTPRPGRVQEESMDCPRTPVRLRQLREGEGTPRHLVPPATPELPTCSPASEAGSENSINMAAHTLMILSRAAIARTGSPLKDSLRQEEAGEKSPTTSKYAKKRKQPATPDSPPAKKALKRSNSSGSKKKEKKQKKLMDSFPDDLDVDKFLSSLHYDE